MRRHLIQWPIVDAYYMLVHSTPDLVLGSSGPHTVSFFKELRTWAEQEMDTNIPGLCREKGLPQESWGPPREMGLNPFCGTGSVRGVNLWRNVYYQKAS